MTEKKQGIKIHPADRATFIARSIHDTVVTFKLEGIILDEEEAYKMAEEAVVNAEKAGRLPFA